MPSRMGRLVRSILLVASGQYGVGCIHTDLPLKDCTGSHCHARLGCVVSNATLGSSGDAVCGGFGRDVPWDLADTGWREMG